MPAKTSRGRTNTNSKFNFGKRSFWRKKSTLIVTAVIILVGAGVILKSFAATPSPTGVVSIDTSTPLPDGSHYVAALQGLGVANVDRVGCSSSNCLSTGWTTLGPALESINVALANNSTGAIVGGAGTNGQYYYKSVACETSTTCHWSAGYSSAGAPPSALTTKTLLTSGSNPNCASLFVVGINGQLYYKQLCIGTTSSTWYAVPGATNITKLFKSSSDASVATINANNVVQEYGFSINVPPQVLQTSSGGAFYPSSSNPVVGTTLADGAVAVGTTNELYVSNGIVGAQALPWVKGTGWSLAFNNATMVTDIFGAGTGGTTEYIVRTINGTVYEINTLATFGATKSASVVSLGGTCGQTNVSYGLVVCIGSDQKVYYRTAPASNNIGWRPLDY